MTIPRQLEERVNNFGVAAAARASPPRTPAQRSNSCRSRRTATAVARRSLGLLSGGPLPLPREAAYFEALCRPRAGQTWLDIGTSSGFYAGVLARAGAEVLACDISPAMLKVAAEENRVH